MYVNDGVRDKIASIIASRQSTVSVAEMRAEEAHLEPEDGDDWMTIDPKELDEALDKYQRKASIMKPGMETKSGDGGGGGDQEKDYDLGQISETFKKFVGHVSDLDGVEFPGEI